MVHSTALSPTDQIPRRRLSPLTSAALFVVIAYAVSWSIWLSALPSDTRDLGGRAFWPFLVLGSFGPLVAALIVAAVDQGRPGVIGLLRRMVRIRFRWWIWLVIFFLLPTVLTIGNLVTGHDAAGDRPWWRLLLIVIGAVPINALVGAVILGAGPIGEEPGWRGLLSTRLAVKLPDLGVAVIVGLIWGFWHTPMFTFPDFRLGLSLTQFIPIYVIGSIPLSYCMLKILRWTRGSVLAAILFHGVVNVALPNAGDDQLWDFTGRSALGHQFLVFGCVLVAAAIMALISRTAAARAITTGPHEWEQRHAAGPRTSAISGS